MTELLLKLIGPVIPVVAALIQLGRESGWLGRGTLRGQRWAFVLIGTIILGGFINSAMTWNTHENEKNERENDERASEEREQQAQKERQEIAEGIGSASRCSGRDGGRGRAVDGHGEQGVAAHRSNSRSGASPIPISPCKTRW